MKDKRNKKRVVVATAITQNEYPELYKVVSEWKSIRGLSSEKVLQALLGAYQTNEFEVIATDVVAQKQQLRAILESLMPILAEQITAQIVNTLQNQGVILSTSQVNSLSGFGGKESQPIEYNNSINSMLDDMLG